MTVAVRLDETGTRYRIFTHFEWTSARSCGTELLRVIPYYMRYGSRLDWLPEGEVTGRVLYDADGTTMVSPYYKLDGSGTAASTAAFSERARSASSAASPCPRTPNISAATSPTERAAALRRPMSFTSPPTRTTFTNTACCNFLYRPLRSLSAPAASARAS